jgi:multiple sugar transport system substrate-binding protein
MGQTRRQFLTTTAVGAGAAASTLAFPMVSRGQTKKLVVWWNRGYYKEEDEAMLKIAEEFRKAKNVDLDISFTIQEDLRNKIISALTARRGPDVAFCFYNDWEIMPKYAWEGQLVETSDTINELKPRYIEKFLEVAYCYDAKAKKRAYYGVPIEAQTMHIHYWRDLVKEAGLPDDPAKIPMKWDEYWAFWKKVQDNLRKKDPAKYAKVYGIGMTESSSASDTIYNFEMALLSYNGQVFSNDGKVVADEPKNREAIVKALKFFGDIFAAGYVPPDTLNWSDGDNNANFHSKSIVMTPNPSVSIPAHHYFNAPDNYFNKSATIEWPDGPDGRKPTYMIAVKTVLFPKDSANKNPELGKEFVKFVVDPKRFTEYVKGANGRWFPAFKDVASDPFFARGQVGKGGEKDPHLPTVTKIYLERNTRVFDHWKTPANSQVYAENVWGKAMTRINVDKWSPEKAADEAIGRVKTIVAQWR